MSRMILLGSSSVTRAKILESRGIAFRQVACGFDENTITESVPKNFVYHAAIGKMRSCESEYGLSTPLLCADTVVTAHGRILRKASDPEEARRILMLQSGSEVAIITCMVYKSEKMMLIDLSQTVYAFAPFDRDDLERYLESGEWRGKAGACMVEGFCKPYIRSVHGLESCAMGLTVEKLEPWLKEKI